MTDEERYLQAVPAMLAALAPFVEKGGYRPAHFIAAVTDVLRMIGASEDEIRMALAGALLCDAEGGGPHLGRRSETSRAWRPSCPCRRAT